VAETAGEAIKNADGTIIVVPDANAIKSALFDEGTKKELTGARIMNASTTNPDEIIEIAREVEKYGGTLSEISMLIGADELRARQGLFLMGQKKKKGIFGRTY
jgi:3-hydroxyisobutyrate dehydrogenase-like beta-hydroxyacid dehydrogenase